MLIFKIATIATFCVTVVWAFTKPGFDSIAAAVTAFAAVAAVFFVDEKRNRGTQSQEISGGSIGVQAGRDANSNKINKR